MSASTDRFRGSGKGRVVAALTSLTLSMSLAACGGGDEGSNKTLVYSSSIAETTSLGQADNAWLDSVEAADVGITFERTFGGALVPLVEILPAVADGTVDAGFINDGAFPQQLPLYTISQMPFVTADPYAQMMALQKLYEENAAFQAEWEKQGVHVLHFLPVGAGLMGSADAVDDLGDLTGQRLRAFGLLAEASAEIGADPVDLPFAELFESLERDVIDGYAGMSLDVAHSLGFTKLRAHLTDFGTGSYSSTAAIINLDTWNSLSEEQQAAMEEVTAGAWTQEALDILEKVEAEACAGLAEVGASLSSLPDTEKSAFKDRVGALLQSSWTSSVTDAGVSADDAASVLADYQKFTAEFEAETIYDSDRSACQG